MTVAELISILQALPQDVVVEVNDNRNGNIFAIEQVDLFDAEPSNDEEPLVVLQVNC